jgi:formyltetrahydrofolate synthetase
MSKLQIKSPVPSDIEIAQSVDPVPVKQLADRLGILEDELDLYGKHKAKVHLSVLDRLKVRFCSQTMLIAGEL